MPPTTQNGSKFEITQLRRTGSGDVIELNSGFVWTGAEHNSPVDTISPKLGTKITRKEMPGSNEVVHHVMAATWQPFEFKGTWKDIWMGSGETMRTYEAFGQFCLDVPLVKITIDALSWTGLIQDPSFTYHHSGWIDWSFTLSPETHDTIDDLKIDIGALTERRSILSWAKDATDRVSALDEEMDLAKGISLKTETFINVRRFLGALDSAVAKVEQTVNLSAVTNLSQDVVSLTKGLGENTSKLLSVLPNAYEQLKRAAIDVAVAFRDERADNNMAFDDLIQVFSFEKWKNDFVAGSWNTAGLAADAAADARSRSQDKPKAIYRPFPGESLERISIRFYGTPDNAALIREKNHLSSIFLRGDEELIIPDA